MRVLCPVDATTEILVCQVRQEPLLPLSHANRGGRRRRVWEPFNASKLLLSGSPLFKTQQRLTDERQLR
jgi:hypothetical protein